MTGQGYTTPQLASHAGNLHLSGGWKPLCAAPGTAWFKEHNTQTMNTCWRQQEQSTCSCHATSLLPFSQLCVCTELYKAFSFSWSFASVHDSKCQLAAWCTSRPGLQEIGPSEHMDLLEVFYLMTRIAIKYAVNYLPIWAGSGAMPALE